MEDTPLQGAKKDIEGGDGAFFDNIAHRYDLLNRVLSMGLDPIWRKKAVAAAVPDGGDGHILDLATGTADLAIEAARRHQSLKVTGVDPSKEMLAIGRDKVADKTLEERVDLALGDGQDLPFENDTFDGSAVAFGIRNFPDRLQGLREMTRVTRPGGAVVILELSEPQGGLMGSMARFYVRKCVPRIGSLLSGSKEYKYLQESIAAFPPADQFMEMMETAGLEDVEVHPLTFGVVNLFVGHAPGQ